MLLNCDLAEGAGYDARIVPWIDQANIACGLHAGSAPIMHTTLKLAGKHNVQVGAHPGYPDPENFGRKSLDLPAQALESWLFYQLGALDAIARAEGISVSYVKPHGALYNDMMRDPGIFETIVRTVHRHDPDLQLMMLVLPDPEPFRTIAMAWGVETIGELFADRNYSAEGHLLPRTHPEALIRDPEAIEQRIAHYLERGEWLSVDGTPLPLHGDSLCVHGDNPQALGIVRRLHTLLHPEQA
jgi:UPF0271 protein